MILAAGLGTRMRSRVPKVLHPLCGRPMVAYVLDAWHDAGIALAIVLAVLVMAVAGSRGKPAIESYHEWPAVTDHPPVHGWQGSASPGLFPLSVAGDELAQ